MSTQVVNDLKYLHPILSEACVKIQTEVIRKYNMPFRLFETGRNPERHQHLLSKGRTQDIFSNHLYDFSDPDAPLYAIAVDFVYFDGKWSWNLRDKSISAWYNLFGNIVLDVCPELSWAEMNRKRSNLNHFDLRASVIEDNFENFPCILRA